MIAIYSTNVSLTISISSWIRSASEPPEEKQNKNKILVTLRITVETKSIFRHTKAWEGCSGHF